MKIRFLLNITLIFLANYSFAQELGIVKGRITDGTSNEILPYVYMRVDGSTTTGTSNLEGLYALRVPAQKEVAITFHYLGYRDTTITFNVNASQTVVQDINLNANGTFLEEVLVKGQLQGQANALNNQKNADNIKNVVSSEQIGRFPDQNTAEALQRVNGVNIQRDQGEGRYVLVRGLAPQFTNVNINGEQIPSPEADVRYVALDVMSSSQLSSMEISKTLTPDMDGDAIGGSVNLITKTATSSDAELNVSLAGGYNNLMGELNSNGAIQYGQRFGKEERLGVMINANYYNNNLGSDNWEREPFDNELELRDYELTRTRSGLSSTIDYMLGQNSKLYVRTIYSQFTDREWRRRYIFVPEDDEIERSTKDRFEEQSIFTVNVGGEHFSDKIQLDYEVQYSYGEQDTPYDNEATFIAGIPSSLDFSSTEFPSFTAENYLDNSEYEFDELEMGNTLAEDRNITAKFNIGIPYNINGSQGLLKFGSKVRLKDKSYTIVQNKYENLGGVPNLDAFEGGLLDDNFLDGEYQLNSALDVTKLISYFNQNPEQFELQIEDKAIDEALESYEATENVYAGYLMAKQQFSKLMLIGGVRYEYTKVDYQSKDVVIGADGDLDEIRPIEGTSDYGMILPQISAKYALDNNTNIRAAATYSYSRPNFSDIVPSQEANIEDREVTIGNPDLAPVKAINLDLLGEHYFSNVGVISGGVFYKKLDDFIYPQVMFNSQYPATGTPIATGLRVTQSQNGESADLLGFEAGFQHKLDFLPGVLKNLSLYLNYTFTHSDSKIQSRNEEDEGTNITESIKLPGQAKHIGNASLAFQSNKFNIRGSLNFNGEYLDEVGGTPEEDIFINDRLQVDLSASYFVTNRLTVFVEFLNLTNQPFEAYQGDENTVIQREFYKSWSRFGIKADLSNFKLK